MLYTTRQQQSQPHGQQSPHEGHTGKAQALHPRQRARTLPGQQQRFEARLASWRKEGGADRDYALAAQVTAPILVQWGAAGPVIPSAMHREIAAAFRGAKVQVMSYPELGHKLVMEDPARTAGDAEKFLNGMNIPR